ncbi:tail assembly chaperone [Mycobacterium phage Kumao]|nr:tail assembly chaperone [Mycobacterium phage Kumao]ATN93988.1 tail assembly chaperone [Mycobacterium phage Kumao]
MAARKTSESKEVVVEEKVVNGEVVLDEDDVWNDLVTENVVPPLKVRGIVLHQPTKDQVDRWRNAKTVEEGERALFGDQYDAIHELFSNQPEYVWDNFNVKYLAHMFGIGDVESLKK